MQEKNAGKKGKRTEQQRRRETRKAYQESRTRGTRKGEGAGLTGQMVRGEEKEREERKGRRGRAAGQRGSKEEKDGICEKEKVRSK